MWGVKHEGLITQVAALTVFLGVKIPVFLSRLFFVIRGVIELCHIEPELHTRCIHRPGLGKRGSVLSTLWGQTEQAHFSLEKVSSKANNRLQTTFDNRRLANFPQLLAVVNE